MFMSIKHSFKELLVIFCTTNFLHGFFLSSSFLPDSALSETTLHELLTALRSAALPLPSTPEGETACAVCQLTTRSVTRRLRAFLAEYVNDPATRETLRRARGFCAPHTRQLAMLGDPLAIAILYSDLARLTRERWEQEGIEGVTSKGAASKAVASIGTLLARWRRFKAPVAVVAQCPGCGAQAEAEARNVEALAGSLSEPEVWEALQANGGLCIPHIQQILAKATPADAQRLLHLETLRLSDLQAELEEIIRKNDYRFRGEAWGPEKDAWRRALDKLKRID